MTRVRLGFLVGLLLWGTPGLAQEIASPLPPIGLAPRVMEIRVPNAMVAEVLVPGQMNISPRGGVVIGTSGNFSGNVTAARYLAGDGTAPLPAYSFTNEPTMGFWRVGAGAMRLTIAGATVFNASATGVTFSNAVASGAGYYAADGTTLLPAYSFTSEPTLGFARINAGIMELEATGGLRIRGSAASSVLISNPSNGSLSLTGDLTVSGNTVTGAVGVLGWAGRSFLTSPANGQMNLINQAGTVGIGFDVTADSVLSIRNRAQSAGGSVLASTYYAGVTGAAMTMRGMADGQLNLMNTAAAIGVGIDVLTDGVLAIRNRAQTAGGQLTVGAGTGTGVATVTGVLSTNVAPVSNVGTADTDLMTYTLPANSLVVNGRGVRITAWGTLAANANSKTIKLVFGASNIIVPITTVASGSGWYFTATVLRTGAATQTFGSQSGIVGNTGNAFAGVTAETLSGVIIIKAMGSSLVGSGDVTQTGMIVEAL